MRKLKLEELGRLSITDFQNHPKIPVSIILDNVRSLHNVGSALRTCDAFLIDKVYLCGITAKPPHRDIRKTALGAEESVNWEYHENPLVPLEQLKSSGYSVISIEQADKSIDLESFNPDKDAKYLLVFGNEVEGVSDAVLEHSDHCVEISQYGSKHSLNVSVSIGIVLWKFACTFLGATSS